jgi:hypothetical protein
MFTNELWANLIKPIDMGYGANIHPFPVRFNGLDHLARSNPLTWVTGFWCWRSIVGVV